VETPSSVRGRGNSDAFLVRGKHRVVERHDGDYPPSRRLVIEDDRVAEVASLAQSAETSPNTRNGSGAEDRPPGGLIKDLIGEINGFHHLGSTDGSVRIRRGDSVTVTHAVKVQTIGSAHLSSRTTLLQGAVNRGVDTRGSGAPVGERHATRSWLWSARRHFPHGRGCIVPIFVNDHWPFLYLLRWSARDRREKQRR